MLFFETKLSFAYTCRSTWPHCCNTIHCRWGRCDTTNITNINAIAAARVPTHCRKLREMAFPWKIREISGNLSSSPGNFWKQRNLWDFSGNGYDRFKCCFWECYVVFYMLCSLFPGKTTGKISHAPIHPRLIYVTYIYPWWIGEWPAYTPIMVFISLYENLYVLCYAMGLKLIDVIMCLVCFIDHICYKYYRHSQNK